MQALVIVEDGNIITSAPYHYGEWGTVDESELETCTSVAGGIHVLGRVPSLQAFDAIRHVGGDVMFDGVVDLDDVDGFPVLEKIGGSLWFTQDTDRIEEVSGFPVLHTVGELTVGTWIDRVSGLGALEVIEGGLITQASMGDVTGLRSLREVRNFLLRGGSLTRESFPALELVHRDMEILRTIGPSIGMPRLREVGRDLRIRENAALEDVTSMGALETVGRRLAVSSNPRLNSDEVREWAAGIEIGESVSICLNLGGEAGDPCPPDVP